MWNRILPISGTWDGRGGVLHRVGREGRRTASLAALALAVVVVLGGCNYSFRAGSFPEHISTIAVMPFENDTDRFELTQEVHQALLQELPGALGVQLAGEEHADAIVQGTITSYTLTAPLYRSGGSGQAAEVLQREVTLRVAIQILDTHENRLLWENRGVTTQGQYLEASETEAVGKNEAIELLVQRIVDGAQSNW